jgi:hypothetical protein
MDCKKSKSKSEFFKSFIISLFVTELTVGNFLVKFSLGIVVKQLVDQIGQYFG